MEGQGCSRLENEWSVDYVRLKLTMARVARRAVQEARVLQKTSQPMCCCDVNWSEGPAADLGSALTYCDYSSPLVSIVLPLWRSLHR